MATSDTNLEGDRYDTIAGEIIDGVFTSRLRGHEGANLQDAIARRIRAELAAERERVEGWSESCERYIRDAHEWRDRAVEVEAQLDVERERYREALEFYADTQNWMPVKEYPSSCPMLYRRQSVSKNLEIVTGDLLAGMEPVKGDRVRFIAEDGRPMFEVCVEDDRTISVRAIDTCRVGGVLYKSALEIRPHVTNVVEVRTLRYHEEPSDEHR